MYIKYLHYSLYFWYIRDSLSILNNAVILLLLFNFDSICLFKFEFLDSIE